ncbi:MAG: FeoB-associated Cys-rich membrane protein [Oscillospiraceae bacterium]|jgi:hypothetical protein|nr:FeoB-associated Cys-rich membrane protein [Oscillospiraceae bacterium]
MLTFLSQNWATILVGALVLLVAALAVASLARDKKNGAGCGCGCDGCAAADGCGEKEK